MTADRHESSDQAQDLRRAILTMRKLRAQVAEREDRWSEPIAIVGSQWRLPAGAVTPEKTWQMLRDGVNGVREVPADRWQVDSHYDADPHAPGKMNCRHGGFLDQIDRFDPLFFKISPREAAYLDPQQRLLLEVAWNALEDANTAPASLMGSATGVFVGISTIDYGQKMFDEQYREGINGYMATGGLLSPAAGRISYSLGLRGPSMIVDTACSSSLVALHLACMSLRARECDQALAGGVNVIASPGLSLVFSKAHMLSPAGACRTFDANADGYVRGEGCVVVMLKRLSDAVRDGDSVQAVVLGSAVNQDGASGGLTVPNGPSQEAVIRKALAQAKIRPADVDYVEAHGTGTPLGDPIEAIALGSVYGEGRQAANPLLIGSIKTNFGHLEAAAGLAGVVKILLALRHEEIPPHRNFERPSPHVPWDSMPLQVAAKRTPWAHADGRRRMAAVSSFGFAGTNAHVILGEAPPVAPPAVSVADEYQILTISAASHTALAALTERYAEWLTERRDLDFADLCYAARHGRSHLPLRATLVARSAAEAAAILSGINTGLIGPESEAAALADTVFVFTGAAGVRPGMARRLWDCESAFADALRNCGSILANLGAPSPESVLFPPDTASQPEITPVARFCFEYAMSEYWRSLGIEPAETLGPCLGAARLEDALRALTRGDSEAVPRRGKAAVAECFALEMAPGAAPAEHWEHWQATLTALAHLYVRGAAVDWQVFDRGNVRRPVPLPVYPFDRERYWMEPPATAAAEASESILGTRLRSPYSGEIRFEARISSDAPWYLSEHRLFGTVVVPAAYWVSMAIAGVRRATGKASCTFEDVRFPEAMILPDGDSRIVQLVLRLKDRAPASFRILSCAASSEPAPDLEWTVHASGRIEETAPAAARIDVAGYCAQAANGLTGRSFYQPYEASGYAWGPRFRWLDRVWKLDPGAGCRLLAPAMPRTMEPGVLFPGLVDSWFHLLIANSAEPAALERSLLIPFSIAALRVLAVPSEQNELWAHLVRQSADSGNAGLSGDLRLFDGEGHLLAEMIGFHLRRAPMSSLLRKQQEPFADLLHEVHWQPQPARSAAGDDRQCLILGVAGGIGEKLAATLSAKTLFLDAAKLRLDSLPLAGHSDVIDLRPLDLPAEQSLHAALLLIQALARDAAAAPLKLWFVTRGAQPARGHSAEPKIDPSQAPIWGLARVAFLEHPGLSAATIDLELGGTAKEDAAALLESLSMPERETAYRLGVRYVPRLEKSSRQQTPKPLKIDPEAVYLITGGLGGLGLRTALWLSELGARHVALVSRGPARSADAEGLLQAMAKLGVEVMLRSADVADSSQVARLISEIVFGGRALRGVIHAAGIRDDRLLVHDDWQKLSAVLAPKVQGTWNLHRATIGMPLDFFVCFSSASGLLGATGQGSYAAANAFLDSFAHYRHSLGLPACAIDWGMWDETGMAAEMNERARRSLIHRGLGLIPVETALAALGHVMSQQRAQTAVVAIDWARHASAFAEAHAPVMMPAPAAESTPQSRPAADLSQTLARANLPERQKLLYQYLETQVRNGLGLTPGHTIDPRRGFAELGMDSLLSVELRDRFCEDLAVSLPATLLLEHSTLETLTIHLLNNALGQAVAFEPTADNPEVTENSVTPFDVRSLSEVELEALVDREWANFSGDRG